MESFDHLNQEDRLKAENKFLKMKLMLEHGAKFGDNENNQLPAEVENEFLNHIAAFEKQFEEHKKIKVFDKIGRPGHFKPVNDIPGDEIEKAWEELRNYLNKHAIDLDVCSPNIPVKELYRFATEELFNHETEDIKLPGWTTNFIYDEFHPDPVYENARMVEDVFQDVFQKDPLFVEFCFDSRDISFNEKTFKDFNTLKEAMNKFKTFFDEINLEKCSVDSCRVGETESFVKGNYKATGISMQEKFVYEGDFLVEFVHQKDRDWVVKKLRLNGFEL